MEKQCRQSQCKECPFTRQCAIEQVGSVGVTGIPKHDVQKMFTAIPGDFDRSVPEYVVEYAVDNLRTAAATQYNEDDVRLACMRTIVTALQIADL